MSTKINLICLPFAGGNKYSYRSLLGNNSAFFFPIAVDYPGRGSRILEDLIADIDILADDLYGQVKPIIDKGEDYAIYGHSLGGLMAYLLTIKILEDQRQAPTHIFITGASGPAAASRSTKSIYLLPQEEFINEVIALGGVPEEIREQKEMLYFLEPILRSDFKASATYKYIKKEPLNIPLTVITGTDEDITPEDILLWQDVSVREVDFRQMTGDHFFILQHQAEIIDIISKKVTQPLKFSSHG